MLVLSMVFSCVVLKNIWAGGHESHGGDLIYCQKSDDNLFEGNYTLDYILTFRKSNNNEDIVDVESWEISRQRIQDILNNKIPILGKSFSEFISLLGNYDDYGLSRIWEEAAFGLYNISDENIKNKIPANCYNGDEINLQQVVIRRQETEIIRYSYDYEKLTQLRSARPLQFSFLMIHEWLRDYIQDPEMIRLVNRFFHSNQFEIQSIAQVAKFLRVNGGLIMLHTLPFESQKNYKPTTSNDKPILSLLSLGFLPQGAGIVAESFVKTIIKGSKEGGLLKAVLLVDDDNSSMFIIDEAESMAAIDGRNIYLQKYGRKYGVCLNIQKIEIINDNEVDVYFGEMSSPKRYIAESR